MLDDRQSQTLRGSRPGSAGRRLAAWLLVLALAGTGLVGEASAAGEEYTRRGDDLVVTVSSRWAGCSNGGYYPIRILVQNRGVDCTATFVFRSEHDGVAGARRTVEVAQNATVKFTLPVPCVGMGSYGELQVYRNGRAVKGMKETLSIPDANLAGGSRPSFLVISPINVDFEPFELAAVAGLPGSAGASYGGYGHYGHYGVPAESHERIDPALLPEEWIAYSGLDLVGVPLETLGKFTASERAALLKWVHTGGTLIVYEVGEEAARSTQLNELLELDQHAAVSPEWQPASLSQRVKVPLTTVEQIAAQGYGMMEAAMGGQPVTDAALVDFLWPEDGATFASRQLMLGHVYAFRENPFPGSASDWNWFLKSVPDEAQQWTRRHGISARVGSDEFLQFLIPSVRGVPVTAFLLLITVFTVIIGPLNYVFLWRRRRLYLLVVTIPLIALGTSVTLFAYSAVAHGFATKSRARTLTFVDQQANTAVTWSRVALYAGLAPSDGLRFSPDTFVMPIWPEHHDFDTATIDWSELQNLRSGWLPSRTRTQFLTVGHRDERGRLDVVDAGGKLKVTNGFEWGFEALIVSDAAGEFYFGKHIPAGASAELAPLSPDQRREFAERLRAHPLAPPDLTGSSSGWFDWNVGSYYSYDSVQARFTDSLLEQRLSEMMNLEYGGSKLAPRSYAAVLKENPGIEYGVEDTVPQATLHTLRGRY